MFVKENISQIKYFGFISSVFFAEKMYRSFAGLAKEMFETHYQVWAGNAYMGIYIDKEKWGYVYKTISGRMLMYFPASKKMLFIDMDKSVNFKEYIERILGNIEKTDDKIIGNFIWVDRFPEGESSLMADNFYKNTFENDVAISKFKYILKLEEALRKGNKIPVPPKLIGENVTGKDVYDLMCVIGIDQKAAPEAIKMMIKKI